jgi:hypothetical protein
MPAAMLNRDHFQNHSTVGFHLTAIAMLFVHPTHKELFPFSK